jgi:lactoylglutathione lyase
MRYTRHGLVLPVADYAGCVAFYRDVLELPVLFALDQPDSVLTGFDLAGTYLLVEPGGIAKTPETLPPEIFPEDAQIRLRFNVADLDGAVAELRGKGVAVERQDHSWGSVGVFRDPDGNICQLRDPRGFGG